MLFIHRPGSGGGVLSLRTAPSRPSRHLHRVCVWLLARVLGAPTRLGAGLVWCVCVCVGLGPWGAHAPWGWPRVVSPSLARACACVVLFVSCATLAVLLPLRRWRSSFRSCARNIYIIVILFMCLGGARHNGYLLLVYETRFRHRALSILL